MNEGIIVLDVPPNCHKCKIKQPICLVDICPLGKREVTDLKKRPEWCPIIYMPMLEEEVCFSEEFKNGWNACIKKIYERNMIAKEMNKLES